MKSVLRTHQQREQTKKILLTRKNSAADEKFFADRNFVSQILPLSVLILRTLTAQDILDLNQSHWVIFTSQTPVKMILSLLTKPIKIACIGEHTASRIRQCGYEPDFVSSKANKEEFVAEWKSLYSEEVQIFYPMSDLAEPIVATNAVIKNVVCYENRANLSATSALEKLLSAGNLDAVYLTSPSAWARFYSVYKNFDFPLKLIAIGKTTQAAIAANGFVAILKDEL